MLSFYLINEAHDVGCHAAQLHPFSTQGIPQPLKVVKITYHPTTIPIPPKTQVLRVETMS